MAVPSVSSEPRTLSPSLQIDEFGAPEAAFTNATHWPSPIILPAYDSGLAQINGTGDVLIPSHHSSTGCEQKTSEQFLNTLQLHSSPQHTIQRFDLYLHADTDSGRSMRRYRGAVKVDVRRRNSPPPRQRAAQTSQHLGLHIVTIYNWGKPAESENCDSRARNVARRLARSRQAHGYAQDLRLGVDNINYNGKISFTLFGYCLQL